MQFSHRKLSQVGLCLAIFSLYLVTQPDQANHQLVLLDCLRQLILVVIFGGIQSSLSRNSKFVEEKAAHLSRAVSIHKEPPKKVSEFSCIFSGSATPFCVCLKSQWKCLYDELIREAKITYTLAHGLKMKKITALYFPKLLKLENSKYLILLNFGSRAEIKTVLIWGWHIFDVVDRKWENGYYISPWAKIEKTKGTLLSPTFKVWESKVPLVLSILAQGLRYSHFLISRIASWWRGWQKMRKSSQPLSKLGKN